MECVILAGGLATRMRPLTEAVPKTLLPVRGVPFAHYQLSWLAAQGVKRVIYCIGHLGDMIRAYVADGSRWGLAVDYVDEGTALRGTAGALRLAHDLNRLSGRFFVLYGDSFLPIAFRPVWDSLSLLGRSVVMTVLRNNGQWDRSNADLGADGHVFYDKRGILPSGAPMQYIDYGLLMMERRVVADSVPGAGRYELPDLLYELSTQRRISGYEVNTRFYEIGSPSGLDDFDRYIDLMPSALTVQAS